MIQPFLRLVAGPLWPQLSTICHLYGKNTIETLCNGKERSYLHCKPNLEKFLCWTNWSPTTRFHCLSIFEITHVMVYIKFWSAKMPLACAYDLNARIEAVSELVLDWELQKGANSPNPAPEEQIMCSILTRLGIYIDLRWASARGFCPKISKHGLWGTHEQMHTLLLRYVALCRMSGTEWMIIYHSRY